MSGLYSVPVGTSVTDWALEHGERFTAVAELDNYSPPRERAHVQLYRYPLRSPRDGQGLILIGRNQFKDSTASMYLVAWPDGTVEAFYVAAWHGDQDHLILNPLAGTASSRGWLLGPRRAYFLSAREDKR